MEKIKAVSRYIKEGIRVGVAETGTTSAYISKITNVNEKTFYMLHPTDNGKKLHVNVGMKLEFVYIIDSGKYSFSSTVLSVLPDNVDLVEMEMPSYLDRLELRKFFRVDMMKSITVYLVEEKVIAGGKHIFEKGDFTPMTCTDLSGGGMKLTSTVKVEPDSILEVDLSSIDSHLPSNVMAKVVRSVDNNDETYTLGIMFTSLTESDRDKIIKFVFQRQTEQRKISN